MITHYFTNDGSSSLYHSEWNDTFHSKWGALEESIHIYIKNGLDIFVETSPHVSQINILEMGFGTGLNALLTAIWSEQQKITIRYSSVEKDPLSNSLFEQLNYGQLLNKDFPNAQFLYQSIFHSPWNQIISLQNHFDLYKIPQSWFDFLIDESHHLYDLIFYDAFAPSKQPEMWTINTLDQTIQLLKKGGMLVTYCSNGQFKRNLKNLGLQVLNPSGPKGRKEMTLAIKS